MVAPSLLLLAASHVSSIKVASYNERAIFAYFEITSGSLGVHVSELLVCVVPHDTFYSASSLLSVIII